MTRHAIFPWASLLLGLALLSGCASTSHYAGPDYSAFKESRPASILVLPPLNTSPDVDASLSMLSQVTYPLAESGYYVVPVTLANETFRQNGLTTPDDIHQLPIDKLHKIFGADAALYINVTQYGTSYKIISSETRVTADGELIDLRNGRSLWKGHATASSAEGDNNNNNGLVGMLVKALINQIADSINDKGHTIAGVTSFRLLAASTAGGLLYGPRSPKYLKEGGPDH